MSKILLSQLKKSENYYAFNRTITINILNSHIGTIYGDSITVERCEEMCRQVAERGFAVSNCIFGIGVHTIKKKQFDKIITFIQSIVKYD